MSFETKFNQLRREIEWLQRQLAVVWSDPCDDATCGCCRRCRPLSWLVWREHELVLRRQARMWVTPGPPTPPMTVDVTTGQNMVTLTLDFS